MGFLILLIVATAIGFAWLLVSVTRLALGDLRLRDRHPGPAPAPDPDFDPERAVREHLYGRRGVPG